MRPFVFSLVLIISLSLIFGMQVSAQNVVSGTGTVVFVDLEGGFFGIISDDDKRFDPINLGPEFRQSGLKVRFTGKVRTDVFGSHMWGSPLELLKIEKLQDRFP